MAPIIAALLSKGLGLVANAVLAKGKDFVKDKTGIDLEKDSLSDQDVIALKKYEMEHEEELMRLRIEDNRLDVELQKLVLADVQSARDLQARVAESPHASRLNKNIAPILAITTIVAAFFLFFWIMIKGVAVDPQHKDIMIYILGVLSAIITQIFSYYFGSSTGSKTKTDQIDKYLGGKGGLS